MAATLQSALLLKAKLQQRQALAEIFLIPRLEDKIHMWGWKDIPLSMQYSSCMFSPAAFPDEVMTYPTINTA